jgi:hypothetical protein
MSLRPKPGVYIRRNLSSFEIKFESLSATWAKYFPGVSAGARSSDQYPIPFGPEFYRQYAEPVGEFVQTVKMLREALDDLRILGQAPKFSPQQMMVASRAERIIHGLSAQVRPMLYRAPARYGLGWACHSLLGAYAMMAMLDLSGARLLECGACQRF